MLYKKQLLMITACLIGIATIASPSLAEDNIVGIIWKIGSKGKDQKMNWGPFFRATPDGKVWNIPTTSVPRVVGTWNGTEDKVKMKIDKIGHPKNLKFNGDYEFVLVGKNPKVWQGTLAHPGKENKLPIFVRLVKD